MKRIILYFYLIVPFFCYSQTKVNKLNLKTFYYILHYQVDSTNINYIKDELFILNENEGTSIFTSIGNFKSDSLLNRSKILYEKTGILDFKGLPHSKFTYYVVKSLKMNSKIISYYDNISKYNFTYDELIENNWILHSDKKVINNFTCQKATIKKYGREFVAWFTKDIPINDGPYKFYGLPGLILELYDTKNMYHFKLIKYDPNDNTFDIEVPARRLNKIAKTEKSKFDSAQKNYKQNTVQRVSTSGFNVGIERLNQIRDRIKEENNPLELKP